MVIHDYWSCSSKEEVSPVSSFTSTGVYHQTYDCFAIVSALKHKIRIIYKSFANQNFPKHSLKYLKAFGKGSGKVRTTGSLYRWKKWWNVILLKVLLWCDLVCRLYLFCIILVTAWYSEASLWKQLTVPQRLIWMSHEKDEQKTWWIHPRCSANRTWQMMFEAPVWNSSWRSVVLPAETMWTDVFSHTRH